jgi:pentatricopeptide repeat protein
MTDGHLFWRLPDLIQICFNALVYLAEIGVTEGLLAIGCTAIGLAWHHYLLVANGRRLGTTACPKASTQCNAEMECNASLESPCAPIGADESSTSGGSSSAQDDEWEVAESALAAAQENEWEVAESALEELTMLAGPESAARIVQTMAANGIQPSRPCFNIVIHSFARAGEADAGVHLLEQMMQQGTPPDDSTFQPVIYIFAKMGNIDGAFRWFGLMRISGVKLSIQSYKTLLCACSSQEGSSQMLLDQLLHGDCDSEVLPSFEEPCGECDNAKSSTLSRGAYNTLVQAWAKAGDPRCAEYWLRKGLCAGHEMRLESYSILADAFYEAGLMVEAASWRRMGCISSRVSMETADDASEAGSSSTFSELRSEDTNSQVSYNDLVQTKAKAGDTQRAEYWLRQAVHNGYEISNTSYSTIASSLHEAGQLEEANLWSRLGTIAARVSSRRRSSSFTRND